DITTRYPWRPATCPSRWLCGASIFFDRESSSAEAPWPYGGTKLGGDNYLRLGKHHHRQFLGSQLIEMLLCGLEHQLLVGRAGKYCLHHATIEGMPITVAE